METAAGLISERIVEADVTDRLASISSRLVDSRANHCVVLDGNGRRFFGIVRLGDVARWSDPGNRILGDLISKVAPMSVQADEPASQIAELFERHELGEAPVFSKAGDYLGLITAESVLKWCTSRMRSADQSVEKVEAQLSARLKASAAFLAAISHELRTPLNPALLVASDRAYTPKNLPEDIRQDFEVIAKSVAAEVALIDDLLEVTQILSGKISLNLKWLPVHELLEKALIDMDGALQTKEISIETYLNAPLAFAYADEQRLKQVIASVLGSVVEHTAASGRITVATAFSDAMNTFKIEIRSSGTGISAGEIERLFAPFSQLDSEGKESIYRHKGWKLNMAIAKHLVELHGGALEAEAMGSDLGTTFTITLPKRIPVDTGQAQDVIVGRLSSNGSNPTLV